jgi:hypothetical protein
VCTNAASRARDGDPRFAPVALAGNIGTGMPDEVQMTRVLRAASLANQPSLWLHPAGLGLATTKLIILPIHGARRS